MLLAACSLGGREGPSTAPPVLRVAIARPSSLDPVFLRDRAGLLVARQIYEPLLRFDPRTAELLPALAESWEVQDEGRRFLFKIRRDARFHNGREVTSDDLLFSLNRLARKATEAETAFLLDAVAGFQSVNVTGEAEALEGLAALDGRTLEIQLSAPWFDFPYVLTSPSTAPVPRGEFEQDPGSFVRQPMGNGPYRLTGPSDGADIEVERSDAYWGPPPPLERIRFLLYDQAETAWRDFEEGRLDVVEAPPGRVGFAEAKYGGRGFSPLAVGLYVAFNLNNEIFSDARLRRAVSMAINRDAIAGSVYAGTMVPADGLVPEGIPGRQGRCGRFCVEDRESARRLVVEAYPEGAPELAYDYPAGVADEATARSLKGALADVGINMVLRPRERELHAFFDLLETNQHEMFRLAWPAEYPLADWFLTPVFRTGSPDNHSGFSSPEVDELLGSARATGDPEERLRRYRDIDARLTGELVVVPVGFFKNRYAAAPRVAGFYADILGGFEVSRLRVDGT